MLPIHNPFSERDTFEDIVFSDLELNGADLSDKDFVRCTFRKMVLQESRWERARLEDCVFDACDLTRMQPRQLAFRNVLFNACRMTGVDFTDIALNPTLAFDGCNLQYASFVKVNLTAAKFLRCKVVEVNFIDVRLPESDFTGSDLGGSNFDHCDLRKADFAGSHGLFVDPSKNRVKAARINMASAVLLAASFGPVRASADTTKTIRSAGNCAASPSGPPTNLKRRLQFCCCAACLPTPVHPPLPGQSLSYQ